MKALVVFYSRTGNTKKIALEIKKSLKADIDEVKDKKDRSGIKGYLLAGKDSILKRTTEIVFRKNPEKYELVVIGTPVWSFTVCPAIRTYITQNKDKLRKVAFFCTQGSNSDQKTFRDMQKLAKKPLATYSISTSYRRIKNIDYKKEVKEFCRKLK
ncbi:hypothetical protein JW707_02420 [Candidatus Woesearchaeota archaeon]|nr:hypothetical protein [Candidatus Woesearchaeota archaeon]